MNADQWISADRDTNRLVLRFRVKGFKKQFYLSTGLIDTPANREIVRLRRDLIKSDIALERFDATLQTYAFNPTRHGIDACPVAGYSLSLGELWQKFTEFKKALLEPTTIKSNYYGTARYIAKLPTQDLDQAPQIRDWLLANTTRRMAWELLVRFSECCNWGVDSGLIEKNPFERLKIKKPRKTSEAEEILAFTLQERDLIIQTFETHRLHAHYAPLVKFLFYTGTRLGEAFALTWGDVSAECTKITINKSCNLYNIRKGTKNGKRRVFTTAPNSKLQNLLLEIKPAATVAASKLVFTSKLGSQMNGDALYNAWYGCFGSKNLFYPGVVRELANQGLVPYLKPYATRHTFATWAIASGITPDRVALLIGDEVSTVLKYYCHPNVVSFECPDF